MTTTKFKNTEIGRIPEDWEVKTIGDVARIVGGGTPSTDIPSYWNGDIQWFTPAEITNTFKYIAKSERTISTLGLKNSSAKLLPKGAILLTTRATIGATAILLREACTNQGFQSLIVNKENSNEFIYYLLPLAKNEMLKQASGSTFPEISAKKLAQIELALPKTIAEQERIATALSSIDTLICDLDRTIEKKQNIRQGAMEQLLSGKSDWVECELSEIINVVKGVQLNGSELLEDGPYPMINGGIEPSGYTTNFNRNAETITISEGGNSCGYVNFIHQKFWAGGHCYCVVVRKNVEIEKDFLYHLLKNNEKAIMAMRVGSGLPNVQSKTLLAMHVSYPADIKEQRAIADSLTALDDEIAMLQLERTKYANIRSGMMDDLLSGTKRL